MLEDLKILLGILALLLFFFVLLLIFVRIGCYVMRVQITFMALVWCALGGSLAATAMFWVPLPGTAGIVGKFIVVALVVTQILWKTTRTDIIPDGVLVVVIGCGLGTLVSIAVIGKVMTYVDFNPVKEAGTNQYGDPYYMQAAGKTYYMGDNGPYYLNEEGNKVIPGMDDGEYQKAFDAMQAGSSFEANEGEELLEEPVFEETEAEEAVAVEQSQVAAESQSVVETQVGSSAGDMSWTSPNRNDQVIHGQPLPIKLMLPRGWIVAQNPGEMWLKYGGHLFIKCYNHDPGLENKSYLNQEYSRIQSSYPGYSVQGQEVVDLGGVSWARLTWADADKRQLITLTHGGKRGCYTVEIQGSMRQIEQVKGDISQILKSIALPPHNFFHTSD